MKALPRSLAIVLGIGLSAGCAQEIHGPPLARTDVSAAGSDLPSATAPAGGRASGPYDLVSTAAGCPLTLPRVDTITEARAHRYRRHVPLRLGPRPHPDRAPGRRLRLAFGYRISL